MTGRDDGGPAFPGSFEGTYGMTLRDYFAAHAPPVPRYEFDNVGDSKADEDVSAGWAYAYADAMLAKRRRKP